MDIVRTLNDLSSFGGQGTAVTIGTFDGFHRGHAVLVETLKKAASERALQTALVTFEDMPYFHFRPEDCSRLLTLPSEKEWEIGQAKIDTLALIPFDGRVAQLSAAEFVRSALIDGLGMKLLVVGPDFALGKGRDGNVETLRRLGKEFGYETLVLDEKIEEGGLPISSTRIRERIESGEVAEAARMLGRNYSFAGEVVGGRQLGRTIGFPTINISVNPRKVLPGNGVYAVWTQLDDSPTWLPAALNIGTRPTVDGASLSVEFHVIGHDIPIAPLTARLSVVTRLRSERKFDGLDALVAQIAVDVGEATRLLQ